MIAAALWAAAGALALAAAGWSLVRAREPFSPDRAVRAALLAAAAAGLLVPAAIGGLAASALVIGRLAAPGLSALSWGDLALTLAACAALAALARRWPAALGETSFVAFAVGAAVAAKLAYVHLVRMPPISDFQGMWAVASALAQGELDAVRASPSLIHRIYLERVLPYFLPLRALLGPARSSYTVANVLVGAASSVLVYRLTRRWFGAPAARIALVASLFAPETFLAAGIPSHDVPGALYTLLGLTALVAGCDLLSRRRWRPALAAACGFGALAVVIDLQRTTGPFFLLPCAAVGVAAVALAAPEGRRARQALAAAAVLLALPAALYQAGELTLRRADLAIPRQEFARQRGLVMAAGTDSWADGSWAHLEQEYQSRYKGVALDWYRLAVVKLASDTWYSPAARLSAYVRKSRLLFDLGTMTWFYLHDATLAGGGRVDYKAEERVVLVSRVFSVLFLAAALLGCLRSWGRPETPLTALLPAVYLAVVAGLLVGLASVQSRYLYQVWYLAAVYVGALLGSSERAGGPAPGRGELL